MSLPDAVPTPAPGQPHLAVLPELEDAGQRLVRRVDELPDASYAAPSALPGWTRGHVVAHLALNAESLGQVLLRAATGAEAAMYPSRVQRDGDIERLAGADAGELRARTLTAGRFFAGALAAMPPAGWEGEFRRTPDAPEVLPVRTVVGMRHREVEFHHVDLDAGYGPRDWPGSFVVGAVEALRSRAPGVTLLATDLGRSWYAERARTTVSGPGTLIAWWLGGRGAGEGLTSNGGELPQIKEW